MLKNLKGSPFSVFRHCETLARHSVHFFKYVLFSIFSLQRVPLQFLWYFTTDWCLKFQRFPLSVFRHCETFFRKFVFSPKGPPSTATKMLTISEVSFWALDMAPTWAGPGLLYSPHPFMNFIEPFWALDMSLGLGLGYGAQFWALDMAPTWAGPGLFYSPHPFMNFIKSN